MISQEADSVFHDAILAEERELRSFRQSGTSGCIGHQADSVWPFARYNIFISVGET